MPACVGDVPCTSPHPGTHSLPSLTKLCPGVGSRLPCLLATRWVWPMGDPGGWREDGWREREREVRIFLCSLLDVRQYWQQQLPHQLQLLFCGPSPGL